MCIGFGEHCCVFVTEKMFSITFLEFYAKRCPIGPNETFVIVLGSTQTDTAAGGCGILLLEDYLIPKLAMCAL